MGNDIVIDVSTRMPNCGEISLIVLSTKGPLLNLYSVPSLQRQHLFPKTLSFKWICWCTGYLMSRLICFLLILRNIQNIYSFKVIIQYSCIIRDYLLSLKGSISLKNRHFIIQKRFNELIYGINTIIKWSSWQPVKFQLVSCSWNEIIFFISLN